MSSDLDQQQEIAIMAAALGVTTVRPAQAILDFCRGKVFGWLPRGRMVATIGELEKLVCEKLRLVIEEVWSDEALAALICKYVGLGELGFASLPHQLDKSTFGTLYERFHADGRSPDRFVAFIDCRTAAKAARRFFTRWHEIAHALTNYNQLELPLKRSRIRGSATERMMDLIAGEFGFYSPLFTPLLTDELLHSEHLTFAVIERLRERFCPTASFQATLNACVARVPFAAAYVEAALENKKREKAALDTRQRALFTTPPAPPKLRLTSVAPNDAGRSMGLHVMLRVPPDSAIWRAFFDGVSHAADDENLARWSHSDGTTLRPVAVHVEARRLDDRVFALIQGTDRYDSIPSKLDDISGLE